MTDQAKKIGTKEFNSTGGRVGAMMFGDFRRGISAVNSAILNGNAEEITTELLPIAEDWKIAFGAVMDIFLSFSAQKRTVELNAWLFAHGLSTQTLKVMLLSYSDDNVMANFYVSAIIFMCAGDAEYSQLINMFPQFADNNTNSAKAILAAKNMVDLMNNGGNISTVIEYELLVANMAIGTDTVITSEQDLEYKLQELFVCTDMSDAIKRANEIVLAAAVNAEFLSIIVSKLAEAVQSNIHSLLIPTISNSLFTYVITNYGQLDQESLYNLLENLFRVVSHPLISIYLARQNPKHIKFVLILRIMSEIDLQTADAEEVARIIDAFSEVDLQWTPKDLAESLKRLKLNLPVIQDLSFNLLP